MKEVFILFNAPLSPAKLDFEVGTVKFIESCELWWINLNLLNSGNKFKCNKKINEVQSDFCDRKNSLLKLL